MKTGSGESFLLSRLGENLPMLYEFGICCLVNDKEHSFQFL